MKTLIRVLSTPESLESGTTNRSFFNDQVYGEENIGTVLVS